ncbi:MAG: restriction endonuclease [Armatimonadota bacterium]
MPIPDYQELMLPLLELAGDGKEHKLSDAIEVLAKELNLTDEERKEKLPSGRQERFVNRVGWARTGLKMAGLIEYVRRGVFRITVRGLEVLQSSPKNIDVDFLRQFPEFESYLTPEKEKIAETTKQTLETPEEVLEDSYQNLHDELAQDLLERVHRMPPKLFEMLVVDLLVAMGYGGSRKDAGKAVGQSGDGGIDGIIKEDKLGLDAVYMQAKRWQSPVGRPVVQGFAGSLEGQRAKKGVLITTSQFTPDALDYIQRIEKKIVLIDGKQLSDLMIENGIGVAQVANYTICKIDIDYFGED